MNRLRSYVLGAWHEGAAPFATLLDPNTGEAVAEASSAGIDFGAVLRHAREVGGPALRAMTFAQRGALLKEMSRTLYAERERLLDIAQRNGAGTRGDAKFDVDGATATLSYYASLGEKLGDKKILVDGEPEPLNRNSARYFGVHLRLPRRGAAVHINAFNFPAWGTFEKAAVSLLAGVPVITKPATATAWVAYEMVKILVESGIMPAGSLQLICGSTGDLLDQMAPGDVLAFTGSASTGGALREQVLRRGAAVNLEADSLNASVLGPDVERGSEVWNWFVQSVRLEMTQKAGQKCTAIRRAIVPEGMVEAFVEDLGDQLSRVVVGNAAESSVTMGPLATANQLRDYREGVAKLAKEARIVIGSAAEVKTVGQCAGGFFAGPVVLVCEQPMSAKDVHSHEVFGPVVTVVPYDGSAEQAATLVAKGGGMLATSVGTDDKDFWTAMALELAPWNGRVLLVDRKVADQVTPHGMVLPNLNHGGPGRAGGGEELGGTRGLDLYMPRTALHGNRALLDKLA